MIRMVVFDMAGTTVNENNAVYKTLRSAINEANFDFSLDEVLEAGAGKEKLQAIRSILMKRNIEDEQLASQIFARFLVLLDKTYSTQEIYEQDNATKLFHALKDRGVLVVLNTGYNRATAETLIKKIGWKKGSDYDLLVTASDVANNRPSPDMILNAMHYFGIGDPAEVMKVGDSTVDVMEGKNAGCRINVGITTGAHTASQLVTANPEYIVHNLIELLPIVAEESQAETV
jgi:phosphonatase-like hydrolase